MSVSLPKLGRLVRVDPKTVWETEAQDFTPWLATEGNLSVLADTLFMELELEAQETNVGRFRADILCKNTDDGSWVLIENQLERTDHRHLGQILTYAAGLHAVTICWIAESFAEEHRATIDWLNEISDDKFQFFGLEIEVWKIGDSSPAPKFNVVSRPNDWTRGGGGPVGENLTPTKLQQRDFWAALMKQLKDTKSSIRAKKPRPQAWMGFSIGRAGFNLTGWLNSKEKWIGVYLYLDPPHAKAHFALLVQRREEIEQQLGELEWRELPDRKASTIRLRRKSDPMRKEDWPGQIEWMIEKLEAFNRTFRPLVKSLDASEWPPGDESEA